MERTCMHACISASTQIHTRIKTLTACCAESRNIRERALLIPKTSKSHSNLKCNCSEPEMPVRCTTPIRAYDTHNGPCLTRYGNKAYPLSSLRLICQTQADSGDGQLDAIFWDIPSRMAGGREQRMVDDMSKIMHAAHIWAGCSSQW